MFSLPLCCLVGEGVASLAPPGRALLALGLTLCGAPQVLGMVKDGRDLRLSETVPSSPQLSQL